MVEIEIRAPRYDEEAEQIVVDRVATVRADGGRLEVDPAGHWSVPNDPVMSARRGRSVDAQEDAEDWARNLPFAYRAGDLIAVVIHDDDPDVLAEAAPSSEPVIPTVPSSHTTPVL